MNAEEIRRGMKEVADAHGPWHSHNIFLGDGVWTLTDHQRTENGRLRRWLQIATDASHGSLAGLRVLDLACEEGLFGIEFARHGATVMGIEGREANVARAQFAKVAIGLDNYDVVLGDVRDATVQSFGEFDVILCFGILYHLDAADVHRCVHNLGAMCTQMMLVSTQYSSVARQSHTFAGRAYWGSLFPEHHPAASDEDRMRNLRASLDNPVSFWPTAGSLYNLLADAGFTSVLEPRIPCSLPGEQPGNQANLVAFRGQRVEVPRSPLVPPEKPARWPKHGRVARHPTQTFKGQLVSAARVDGLPGVARAALEPLRGVMRRES